jgi:hypothetical protein
MPWIAVKWADDRKRVFSQGEYNIQGIPQLLVMNKDGTVKNKNGRSDVTSGRTSEEIFNSWK